MKWISAVSYTHLDVYKRQAFVYLSKKEGIIPALESAHAIAYIMKNHGQFSQEDVIVINLSGRGDKDVENVYVNYM